MEVMNIVVLALSGLLIISFLLLSRTRKKLKVHVKVNEQARKQNKIIESELSRNQEELSKIKNEIENSSNALDKLKDQAEQASQNFLRLSMEVAESNFEHSMEEMKKKYETAYNEHEEIYLKTLKDSADSMNQLITTKKSELKEVEKELYDIRNTRAALIEAQLREKRINEQLDFYCLHLDPVDESDILILEKVKTKLNKPRILSMLIWQTFYLKQMNTLVASVVGEQKISGIYKITNIETNECYIGQAVDIGARFKEHAKCGLGIDAPAGNKLYKAMQKFGLTKFSWEVLEECASNKLNEKEAYFIDLYKSVDFGYNTLKGVKK